MYVYLNDLFVCHHHKRIPHGRKISLEGIFFCLWKGFFGHNHKFRTITERDIGFFLGGCCYLLDMYSGLHRFIIRLFSEKGIKSASEHFQQSLAAGIHHACLRKDREDLRCLTQHIVHMIQNLPEKYFQICLTFFAQFLCLFRPASGNCEDRTLFGLHNGFIGGFHRFRKGIRQNGHCHLLIAFNPLCESSEKLG